MLSITLESSLQADIKNVPHCVTMTPFAQKVSRVTPRPRASIGASDRRADGLAEAHADAVLSRAKDRQSCCSLIGCHRRGPRGGGGTGGLDALYGLVNHCNPIWRPKKTDRLKPYGTSSGSI